MISDAEKQHTMNVFLGVFRPESGKPAIWEKEYNSDYYLHHQVSTVVKIPVLVMVNMHTPFVTNGLISNSSISFRLGGGGGGAV
jgi:hypothetical protein